MKKRALLVGINYPNTDHPLRGCVNDVLMMNEVLTKYYGFRETKNKRMLTDNSATTQNIKERLEWLVDGAEPGDVLYFHFSGHGSQLVDTKYDTDSEPDGLDEIICVGGTNIISTNIGFISAASLYDRLQQGEQIKAKIGNNYENITNSYKTTKNEYVEIISSNGIKSYYGLEHPLFVLIDGKLELVKSKDLKKNDTLLYQHNIWSEKYTEDMMWYMIGLFSGDGYFLSDDTIRFSFRSYLDHWRELFTNIENVLPNSKVDMKFNKRKDLVIQLTNPNLTKILKSMGFKPQKAKTERIIENFYIPNDPRKSRSFLRGIFDADGSSSKKMINLVSNDYDMCKNIHILLNSLGINNTLTSRKYNFITINNSNAINFLEKVGFGINEKNKKINVSLTNRFSSGIKGSIYLPSFTSFFKKWNIKIKYILNEINSFGEGAHKRLHGGYFTEEQFNDIINWLDNLLDKVEFVLEKQGNVSEQTRKSIGGSMGNVAKILNENQYSIHARWSQGDMLSLIKYSKQLKKDILSLKNKYISLPKNFKTTSIKNINIIKSVTSMYDFTVQNAQKFESDGILVHNCPVDLDWREKVIRDDDLKAIFDRVPEGVNLTVVLDCCHSGGGIDSVHQYMPMGVAPADVDPLSPNRPRLLAMPADIANRGYGLDLKPKPRKVQKRNNTGILISGCQAQQTSADAWIHNKYVGACTFFLLHALQAHNYDITYKDLVDKINKDLAKYGYTQRPELNGYNKVFNHKFLKPLT